MLYYVSQVKLPFEQGSSLAIFPRNLSDIMYNKIVQPVV